MNIYPLIKPLIFQLEAEHAHNVSIIALKCGMGPKINKKKFEGLKVDVAGIEFENPVGLAAGYDKNGRVIAPLLNMGFSHVEIGTVTPNAQMGNPKPRMFRLENEKGVVNRLGFNNKGCETVWRNVSQANKKNGVVGVNVGANKDTENFVDDYVVGVKKFSGVADYMTLNISSPNTKGLRELQKQNELEQMLKRIGEINNSTPLFLKIAPDIDEAEMDEIAKVVGESCVKGIIVSNTTIQHDKMTGGLSGVPLFERSTQVLAKMYKRVGHEMPIVGVGGIHDGQSAWDKIEAGATLIQLYSALVYQGPKLVEKILKEISEKMEKENIKDIKNIVGRKAHEWAKPL